MRSVRDNRTILLYSMKGGSGTTVTAALTALWLPGDSLIVDLDGDMTDVLGIRPPAWTLDDYLIDPSIGNLDDLVIEVAPSARLLPSARSAWPSTADERQRRALHDWLDRQRGTIIIDAGTGVPDPDLVERAERTLVVTRSCYLSLIRGARSGFTPDGVIVIKDHQRALGPSDIERSLNAPIVATVDVDPEIARMVDAGLLVARSDLHGRQLDVLHTPGDESATALDRWREAKPGRFSPDVDYGMQWQKAGASDQRWRVSWNIGSGDLYAIDQRDQQVIDIAHFDTQDNADRAIEDWAELHRRPDGLDKLQVRLDGGSPSHDLALP
ncbi:MAG: hypothetical protein ACE37B_11030 [Ilumatobacter sp.]|uniref:hypothetical protein n=1 Tax=Ilumatobacter sp. TaxID=1967498 RepID=UPI00391918D1